MGKHSLGKLKKAKNPAPDVETDLQEAAVLHEAGELALAEAAYKKILAKAPLQADALYLLGYIQQQKKDWPRALKFFDRALRVNPDNPSYLINRAATLWALDRFDAALADYGKAAVLDNGNPESHYNLGVALASRMSFDEAVASFNQALALQPDHSNAQICKDKALASLRQTVILVESPETLVEKGYGLESQTRYTDALACYRAALAIDPECMDARWMETLVSLRLGDFGLGFANYELRWQNPRLKLTKQEYNQELWLGQASLAGKTILLHAEQGYGDTLQFCRYAQLLSQPRTVLETQGATVFLLVPAPLKNLLTGLSGVSQLFVGGETLPHFDYHCPLMSLALGLGTKLSNIPANIPYIFSSPDKVKAWQVQLGENTGTKMPPRVGLVWSGNAKHANDLNRSIPLKLMLKLIADIPAQFVSLQNELRPVDQLTLGQHPKVRHFGNQIKDFSDTAGLLELMDLVICVDTSVAHLAGAMGKPVWLLLPFNADWRWLIGRDDSPWYPTIRLFRQSSAGDWDSVLDRVKQALQKYVGCA